MKEQITLSTLARRFNKIEFRDEEPESFNIFYQNNSSVGNRYIRWHGVWAAKEASDDSNVIDIERVYKECAHGACEWRPLFEGIYFGLIVGPKTLAAVEECLEILRHDVVPKDDGTKSAHYNHLGGRNMLDKPTFHDWDLTDRLGKILSGGFFKDRNDKTLYSEDFVFTFNSRDGWSRST